MKEKVKSECHEKESSSEQRVEDYEERQKKTTKAGERAEETSANGDN